jgi:hypothetical protein
VESFGAHPVLQEVSKPPRGLDPVPQRPDSRSDTHPYQSRGQGASLEQFPAYSDGLNFRTSFPAGSGYRTSPELHIFADRSVHALDLLSSSDHGYFYVI